MDIKLITQLFREYSAILMFAYFLKNFNSKRKKINTSKHFGDDEFAFGKLGGCKIRNGLDLHEIPPLDVPVSRMSAPPEQSPDVPWAPCFTGCRAMCPLIAVLGCK